VDTAPFIYFIEERAKYLAVVDSFFGAVNRAAKSESSLPP